MYLHPLEKSKGLVSLKLHFTRYLQTSFRIPWLRSRLSFCFYIETHRSEWLNISFSAQGFCVMRPLKALFTSVSLLCVDACAVRGGSQGCELHPAGGLSLDNWKDISNSCSVRWARPRHVVSQPLCTQSPLYWKAHTQLFVKLPLIDNAVHLLVISFSPVLVSTTHQSGPI